MLKSSFAALHTVSSCWIRLVLDSRLALHLSGSHLADKGIGQGNDFYPRHCIFNVPMMLQSVRNRCHQ